MTSNEFRAWCVVGAAIIGAANLSVADAQTAPDPVKHPNPATSTTTDDDGNNPLAREGENSPTGHNPSVDATVGGPLAQTADPSKHANPATSASTDDEGNNALAREGENSPTGHNPSVDATGVVGRGTGVPSR